MSGIDFMKKKGANLLIVGGIFIMVSALFTFFRWQMLQEELVHQYDKDRRESTAQVNEIIDFHTISQEDNSQSGIKNTVSTVVKREEYEDGMMVINIPKLEVRAAVMNGTDKKSLKKGPGLYEISPLPAGEKENVCIAGHRSTYGAWFRYVDTLIEGDDILLEFKGVQYVYGVEDVFIIKKNDWSVTESLRYPAITLTACHPVGSAKERIVVRAKLHKVISFDIP